MKYLLAWIAISFVAAVLLGKFIKAGRGRE